MFEPGSPVGLGCIVSGGCLRRPVALYATVPDSLLKQLLPRETFINQAEMLALLLGPSNLPEVFQGSDVVSFVDNTSALEGAISGVSPVEENAALLACYPLLLAKCCSHVNTPISEAWESIFVTHLSF